MSEEIPEWQRRLEAAVAKNVQRRSVKSKERAEFAERRAYGLVQRYAAKTARLKAQAAIDARVAAGELIRLPGGHVIEAERYDVDVHGPREA